MDRKAIGTMLKELRGERSMDEVAKELGCTAMAISLWERGERIPSDDMKIKIAAFYGKSVTEIFFNGEVNETLTST